MLSSNCVNVKDSLFVWRSDMLSFALMDVVILVQIKPMLYIAMKYLHCIILQF